MLTTQDLEKIQEIAAIMKRSKQVLAITGAGISAESGLPTYRGIGGLYNDQHTEEGMPIEVMLSNLMLKTRPEIAWKYLAQMEKACRAAHCNQAHRILADFDKRFERVLIFTQNVDGFHKEAGSRNIIDIHGDFHFLYCMNYHCAYNETVEAYGERSIPPVCPQCGHLLRPDVVLFGEILPQAKVLKLNEELAKGFDIIFSIGTTSVFPYIVRPVEMGKKQGIPTVEINPGATEISEWVDYKITAGAVEALTALTGLLV